MMNLVEMIDAMSGAGMDPATVLDAVRRFGVQWAENHRARAAERQRKSRERRRSPDVTVTGPGAPRERVVNTSFEEEREREPPPLPKSWAPKAEHYAQAKQAGGDAEIVEDRAVLFRSHAAKT